MRPNKKRNAEFEEKAFEIPLFAELCSNRRLWTPGQVLESSLGFDGALTAKKAFSQFVGSSPPKGVSVSRVLQLVGLNTKPPPKPKLATFMVNLFLQVKRSTAYKTRPNGTKGCGDGPWYSFDVNQSQRRTLSSTHTQMNASTGGLAVDSRYIAPCFWEYNDLLECTINGKLLENSNCPTVDAVGNHKRYAYQSPGTNGYRLSKAEEATSPILLEGFAEPLTMQAEELSSLGLDDRRESTIRLVHSELQRLWVKVLGSDPPTRANIVRDPILEQLGIAPDSDRLVLESALMAGGIAAELGDRSTFWFVQIR